MATDGQPLVLRPADPDAPIHIDESKLNPRVMEIKEALVKAVGAVFREKNITHAEYERFREALRALQELKATEGFFDIWLDQMTDQTTAEEWEGTSSNPEGPFFVPGVPLLQPIGPGASYVLPMRPDEPGQPLIVRGQVRSLDGKPLAGAELDTWQCADTGVYSMLGMDDQPDWNLRGKFRADEDGRFEFRTIKPVPYMSPDMPQILLDFYDANGKARFRPRHLHFKVSHEDIADNGRFMTQMYFEGDPYLAADPGENSRASLAVPTVRHEDPEELTVRSLEGQSFYLAATFDIVIATGASGRP
ncbi:hypothetical protein [Streptomyces sp. NPDC096311]|uniref:dioxygenase family protein n=1 Tax=Streptomyces sp. NPDC096311 TaxID=3366083 RepID=UPI00380A4F32